MQRHPIQSCSQRLLAALALCIASAAAQAEIKIGMVLPLSGPLANTGNEIANGTRAVIDDLNANGGMRGKKIELIIEDDKFDAVQTEAIARRLIKERGVNLFLSCFGTVNCLALSKASSEANIPLLAPMAGADALHQTQGKSIYALRASATEEVSSLLQYATPLGIKQMSVLVQDDGFGRGYSGAMDAAAAKLSVQIRKVMITPANANYTQAAAELLGQDSPPAIVLLANTVHSTGVLKALEAKGYFGMALNLAGQANQGFVNTAAGLKQLAIFVTMTPSPFSSATQVAQDYRRQWQAQVKNDKYSYLSFEAYLNARVAVEALRRSDAGRNLNTVLNNAQFVIGGHTLNTGIRKQAGTFTDVAVLTKEGRFRH